MRNSVSLASAFPKWTKTTRTPSSSSFRFDCATSQTACRQKVHPACLKKTTNTGLNRDRLAKSIPVLVRFWASRSAKSWAAIGATSLFCRRIIVNKEMPARHPIPRRIQFSSGNKFSERIHPAIKLDSEVWGVVAKYMRTLYSIEKKRRKRRREEVN